MDKELSELKKELRLTRLFCIVAYSICFYLSIILYVYVNKNFNTQIEQVHKNMINIEEAVKPISSSMSNYNNMLSTKSDNTEYKNLEDKINNLEITVGELSQRKNYNCTIVCEKEVVTKGDSTTAVVTPTPKKVKSENTPTNRVYTHDVITSDGIISKEYFNSVSSYYDMIPEIVRRQFSLDGWKISVVSYELHYEGVSSRILALTVYDEKTIYISKHDASSVIHEIGHYIDWKTDCSPLLQPSIYDEELQGLIAIDADTDSHNYLSVDEYFAECFSMYILKPSEFKEHCPKTCALIENTLRS